MTATAQQQEISPQGVSSSTIIKLQSQGNAQQWIWRKSWDYHCDP